jgi:hypothetical protein
MLAKYKTQHNNGLLIMDSMGYCDAGGKNNQPTNQPTNNDDGF